jgi:membrane protein implicated in regulation of membrane protease activity
MPFDFVLIVVALTFAYKLLDVWLKHKVAQRSTEEPSADLLRKLAEVEERVRVLERIVTDERYDLKRQFKDLGA